MEAPETTGPPEQPSQAPPPPASPSLGELDATLDHLERLCGRLEHAEQRFKQLTDECEGVLHGLVAVDKRHSSAVASLNERLGEWCNLEGKLLQESARRIDQFERGVGHEWMVIRQMHEEPIAELKDQAAQLRLACLEAARLARFRLDSAEKAYSAYAADLERRMAEWSQELLKVARSRGLTDGTERSSSPGALASHSSSSPVEPWPLEGVAQLHHELRTGGQAGAARPSPDARRDRASAVQDSPADGQTETPPGAHAVEQRGPVRRLVARPVVLFALAGVLVVAALGVYAWRAGASDAGRVAARPARPAPATAAAPDPPAAAAPAPQRPSVSPATGGDDLAQREAERVGAMVEILAAADLRRYALASATVGPSQPYGQVLWSRSRGLAASASRLASLPEGKVYQLWIVPDGPAVAAGVLAPDAAGRASLVLPGPLKLPLPVTIRVTIENRGQATRPLGPVCLVRVPST